MFAIETKDLCKNYKDKEAVKNLNLHAKEDQIYALLGLNGAGKSTTIKMLTGLIQKTSGEARVEGLDLSKQLSEIKKITSVSPQDSALAMKMNVEENLMMMARIYGISKSESIQRVNELIDQFHLEEFRKKQVKKLSGGYQRRLSIAMAIISKPKVLFLDEPTLGLDVLTRRELWKLVVELKKSMTIILTTHYLEEAEALADFIGIIKDGELIIEGNLKDILEKAKETNLENAFVKLCGGDLNEIDRI